MKTSLIRNLSVAYQSLLKMEFNLRRPTGMQEDEAWMIDHRNKILEETGKNIIFSLHQEVLEDLKNLRMNEL